MDDREQRAEAWRERYDETGFGEDVKTAYLEGAESEAAHQEERIRPLLEAIDQLETAQKNLRDLSGPVHRVIMARNAYHAKKAPEREPG